MVLLYRKMVSKYPQILDVSYNSFILNRKTRPRGSYFHQFKLDRSVLLLLLSFLIFTYYKLWICR